MPHSCITNMSAIAKPRKCFAWFMETYTISCSAKVFVVRSNTIQNHISSNSWRSSIWPLTNYQQPIRSFLCFFFVFLPRFKSDISTLLFHVVLEAIVRRAKLQTTSTIFNKQTQLLAYADDIDIVGISIEAVRDDYLVLEAEEAKLGLKINEQKIKYIITRDWK
jgi:hypothetical protein